MEKKNGNGDQPARAQDYEPFGPEWEKEMMKFNKAGLIEMLRQQMKVRLDLEEAISLIQRHFPKDVLENQMGEDFNVVARCLPL